MKKLNHVEKITNNKFVNLYKAKYSDENNNTINYELASRRDTAFLTLNTKTMVTDAVKVLPYTIDKNGVNIIFIKEFRYSINDYIIALPAGLVDDNEELVTSVARELKEEIGADVISLKSVCPTSFISTGLGDETLACFFAQVELNHNQQLGHSEEIEIISVPLNSALEFLNNAPIVNLQTRLLTQIFVLEQQLKI